MEWLELIGLIIAVGWGLNLLTTAISTLNDIWWKNLAMAQGAIACLAFSWIPYFVTVAAALHFTKWCLGYERTS